MNANSTDFKQDLAQIVGSYLNTTDALEFNRYFLMNEPKQSRGINHISAADRSQLDFEISHVKDRFSIDRTITMASKKLTYEKYLQLLTKLSELCISHGYLNFADEIITKIKNECKINSITANSMLSLSDLYAQRGKWDISLTLTEQAKKYFEEENNSLGIAKCDNSIGTIYGERGNLAEAAKYFEQSLQSAINFNDKQLIAMLNINLGIINNIHERYVEALNYFNDALRLLEELGDLRRIAEVRHNIGMMYQQQKYYHSALQQFDSAITIAIKNEYYPILAVSYINKSEILLNLEEYSFANAIAKKAMEIAHILDDKVNIAEVYRLQGIINKHLKNYKLAENNLLSALRLNKALNLQINIADCYYELASLFNELQKDDQELKYLNYSYDHYREINALDSMRLIEQRVSNLRRTSHLV